MSGSKFGRCKDRPSNKRYTNEQRWVKNKERRAKRHAKRMATQAAKVQRRAQRLAASRPFSEPHANRRVAELV